MRGAERILALALAGVLATTAAAAAFHPKTRVVKDAAGDVKADPVDLVRVSLGRASNGELRASLTAAEGFKNSALVAADGIPGSVCVRLWTTTKPGGTPPDYLVCATATKDGKGLDGSVLRERTGDTPVRVGPAHVTRASSRNVTLRFGQSRVGRPALIRFAGESTGPGCDRIACTDTAPRDGRVARFRLRRA
jgi:hypothetical protein